MMGAHEPAAKRLQLAVCRRIFVVRMGRILLWVLMKLQTVGIMGWLGETKVMH
jgi:hypothetical protein